MLRRAGAQETSKGALKVKPCSALIVGHALRLWLIVRARPRWLLIALEWFGLDSGVSLVGRRSRVSVERTSSFLPIYVLRKSVEQTKVRRHCKSWPYAPPFSSPTLLGSV